MVSTQFTQFNRNENSCSKESHEKWSYKCATFFLELHKPQLEHYDTYEVKLNWIHFDKTILITLPNFWLFKCYFVVYTTYVVQISDTEVQSDVCI